MSLHRPIKTRVENGRKVRSCLCGRPLKECTCERSEFYYCAFTFRGKAYFRNTGSTDVREARKFEATLLKGLRSERQAAVMAALDEAMMVRRVCTIGEILDAYGDARVLLIDARVARRNARSLVLVIAWGKGMWVQSPRARVEDEAVDRYPNKKLEPDVSKIRALPASVLTKGLVLEYQRARLGTEGVDFNKVYEGSRSINSMLRMARDVFSKRARGVKLEGLVLPDLKGFTEAMLLRQAAGKPDPLSAAEFGVMCEQAEVFIKSGDEKLRRRGMMNLMLRQSGMRVGSLKMLDGSWVRRVGEGWVCDLKRVKGGTEPYTIPVSERFAGFAREAAAGVPLFGVGWDEIWGDHNAWLAGIIGGAGDRSQKAHRLRDTAGTIVKCWLGLPAAVELLGHGNASMTIKSYAKLQWEVSELMKSELGAAKRLVPAPGGGRMEGLPENVVPMTSAA